MSHAIDELDLIEHGDRMAESMIDSILTDARKPMDQRRRLTYREKCAALEFETLLICTAAANIRQGMALTAEDVERVWTAHERIRFVLSEGA